MKRAKLVLMALTAVGMSACASAPGHQPISAETAPAAKTAVADEITGITFPAVKVERRFIFRTGEEAAWPKYEMFIYLLFEPKPDHSKVDAALRAYVCGYSQGGVSAGSMIARGVFIVPILPRETQSSAEPPDRNHQIGWVQTNYDYALARELIESLVGKVGGIAEAHEGDIYFAMSDGPLASSEQLAIFDITKLPPDEIFGWIFNRMQDLTLGRAKSTRDIERIAVSLNATVKALGRRFGSILFAVTEVVGVGEAQAEQPSCS